MTTIIDLNEISFNIINVKSSMKNIKDGIDIFNKIIQNLQEDLDRRMINLQKVSTLDEKYKHVILVALKNDIEKIHDKINYYQNKLSVYIDKQHESDIYLKNINRLFKINYMKDIVLLKNELTTY